MGGQDGISCELCHLSGRGRNLSSVAVALRCCFQGAGAMKPGEGGGEEAGSPADSMNLLYRAEEQAMASPGPLPHPGFTLFTLRPPEVLPLWLPKAPLSLEICTLPQVLMRNCAHVTLRQTPCYPPRGHLCLLKRNLSQQVNASQTKGTGIIPPPELASTLRPIANVSDPVKPRL